MVTSWLITRKLVAIALAPSGTKIKKHSWKLKAIDEQQVSEIDIPIAHITFKLCYLNSVLVENGTQKGRSKCYVGLKLCLLIDNNRNLKMLTKGAGKAMIRVCELYSG